MFNNRTFSNLLGSLPVGFVVVSIILALAATIAVYTFIMPESKRPSLSGFAAALHDIFQFKGFLLEKIIKALYVFSTIYMVISGIFTLFKSFGIGLATMLLGPIVLRLVYEIFMLTIILVKNVADINRKLSPEPGASLRAAHRSATSTPETRYEPLRRSAAASDDGETKRCSVCGKRIPKEAVFCKYCGSNNDDAAAKSAAAASELNLPGDSGTAARPASWQLPDDFT